MQLLFWFADSRVLPICPLGLPDFGDYSHASKPAPMPSHSAQHQPPPHVDCPTGSGGFFAPLAIRSAARMHIVSLLAVWQHACVFSAGSPHPAAASHLRAVLVRCGLNSMMVLHEQLLHLRFCCPVPLLRAPPGNSQKQSQQDAPAEASPLGLLERLGTAGAEGNDDVTLAGAVSHVAAISQAEVAQELSALSDRLLDNLAPAQRLLDPAAAPVGSSAAATAAEEQQGSGGPVGPPLQQAAPVLLADAVPLILRNLPLVAQHASQSQLQQAFTAMMRIAGAAAGAGKPPPAGPQHSCLALAVASALQADTGLFEQAGSRYAFVTATLAQLHEVVSGVCAEAAAPAAGQGAPKQRQDDSAGHNRIRNLKAADAAAARPQGSSVCATARLLLQQLADKAASDSSVPQLGQLLEAAAAVLSTVGPALAPNGTPTAGGSEPLPTNLQSVAAACVGLQRALELAAGAAPALDADAATKLALAVLVCQAVLAAQFQAELQSCGKQHIYGSLLRVPQLARALLAGQRLLLALLQRPRAAAGALASPTMLPKVLAWQHTLCCWSEASSRIGSQLGASRADEQQQLSAGGVVEGSEAGGSTSALPRPQEGGAGLRMGLAGLQDSTSLVVQTLVCQALLFPDVAAQRQPTERGRGTAVLWMQDVAGQLQVCPGMACMHACMSTCKCAVPLRGRLWQARRHQAPWISIRMGSAQVAMQTCSRWVR